MDDKTIDLLKQSIQHWYKNVTGPMDEVSIYADNCPLCDEFGYEFGCAGRPVAERTGLIDCEGSAWQQAYISYRNWEMSKHNEKSELLAALAFREAARKELEFLESLLPVGEK